MRVLLTGMSGTGKSSLGQELRQRGCRTFDLDDDGLTGPGTDGRWHWRASAVADRVEAEGGGNGPRRRLLRGAGAVRVGPHRPADSA